MRCARSDGETPLDLLARACEESDTRVRFAAERAAEALDLYRAEIETARRRLGLHVDAALRFGDLTISSDRRKGDTADATG